MGLSLSLTPSPSSGFIFLTLKSRFATALPKNLWRIPICYRIEGRLLKIANRGLPRLTLMPCEASTLGITWSHLCSPPVGCHLGAERLLIPERPFPFLQDASSFFKVCLSKSPPQRTFPKQSLVLLTPSLTLSISVVVKSKVCTGNPVARTIGLYTPHITSLSL